LKEKKENKGVTVDVQLDERIVGDNKATF